jgi:UPF0271 protein
MKLNCDLGESFGSWTMGLDEQAMPHIDQANIACGFHAGDPLTMQKTLLLAKKHQVSIGAHPSYPDLVGFGRRSLNCTHDEIIAFMLYQLAAIDGMSRANQIELTYVKPHGALYNDMMSNKGVRLAILQAVSQFNLGQKSINKPALKLMLQATPELEQHKKEAAEVHIDVIAEAFADRCYDDSGRLLSRNTLGAVHNKTKMLAQVNQLCKQGSITTITGKVLALEVDSICVHGDNIEGVEAIAEIRTLINTLTNNSINTSTNNSINTSINKADKNK